MAGTTAVAGLAAALWSRLSKVQVPAVAPRVDSAVTAAAPPVAFGERPYDRRAAARTVVLRGPIEPPERPGRLIGGAHRVPDTFVLVDEDVLAAVQHDREIPVRGPGGSVRTDSARAWWRRMLLWLTARRELSLALTALDPLGPGQRACVAVEPGSGLVSRSGVRARTAWLDLRRLVEAPGRLSSEVAHRVARDALRGLGGAGAKAPVEGGRSRVMLTGLHPALRRLGVRPDRYPDLRLAERLLESAVIALERAEAERLGVSGSAPDVTPGWPAMATDVARLRRGRLSVLSPFEFLPANGENARSWLDLLPAIRLVDAVSWRRPRRLRGCGPDELAALYRLTWAVRRTRTL